MEHKALDIGHQVLTYEEEDDYHAVNVVIRKFLQAWVIEFYRKEPSSQGQVRVVLVQIGGGPGGVGGRVARQVRSLSSWGLDERAL